MSEESTKLRDVRRIFISFRMSDRESIDALTSYFKWPHVPLDDGNLEVEGPFVLYRRKEQQTGTLSGDRMNSFTSPSSRDGGVDFVFIDGFDQLVVLAPSDPPRFGERLINLMLSCEEREYLVGDLAEEYVELRVKFGNQFANAWYRRQVYSSLLPLISKSLYRKLSAWVVKWFRRLN